MHPTDNVTVTLRGLGKKPKTFVMPFAIGKCVEGFITASLKPAHAEKLIPAREVFPELDDDVLRPATVLRGIRYREELTQKELAKRLGIHQHHLSEMENAKRPIGKQMAKRLAEVLGCDYRLFM